MTQQETRRRGTAMVGGTTVGQRRPDTSATCVTGTCHLAQDLHMEPARSGGVSWVVALADRDYDQDGLLSA
jgi:hypothetical protein